MNPEKIDKLIKDLKNLEDLKINTNASERYLQSVEEMVIDLSKKFSMSIYCISLVDGLIRSNLKNKDVRIIDLIEKHLEKIPKNILEHANKMTKEIIKEIKEEENNSNSSGENGNPW